MGYLSPLLCRWIAHVTSRNWCEWCWLLTDWWVMKRKGVSLTLVRFNAQRHTWTLLDILLHACILCIQIRLNSHKTREGLLFAFSPFWQSSLLLKLKRHKKCLLCKMRNLKVSLLRLISLLHLIIKLPRPMARLAEVTMARLKKMKRQWL
jgi:hypothetical protein